MQSAVIVLARFEGALNVPCSMRLHEKISPYATSEKTGYSQVLWIFGEEDEVMEVGVS